MHQQYLHNATSTLNYMSSSELQELFNDDEKLDEKIDETVRESFLCCCQFFFLTNDQFSKLQLKSLESEKDEIINENRRIAESNLEKEPKLIELRSTINELTTNGKELSEKVQSQLAELSESYEIMMLFHHIFTVFHLFRVQIILSKSRKHAKHPQSSCSRVRREK